MALFLLLVIVGGIALDDGCCSEEFGANTSISASDAADNSPVEMPGDCECPQCISCFRCGHFTADFTTSLSVTLLTDDANSYAEFASFFATSPYISGLKRPPIT